MTGRDIRVIDSDTASYGFGLLAIMASEMSGAGASADEIEAMVEARKHDSHLFVVLETLEYLKRGGRISAAQAAIGGILSVKPIITIEDGLVETADKPRTRSKARERLLELITARPIERAVVLSGMATDPEAFATELAARRGLVGGTDARPVHRAIGRTACRAWRLRGGRHLSVVGAVVDLVSFGSRDPARPPDPRGRRSRHGGTWFP